MSELFVLLGRPVAHSLSPHIHETAFRAAGIDARYVALHVEAFEPAWAAIRRLGVRGGNVTVPWKGAALRGLDRASATALRARAANTFWRTTEGGVAGTETDGQGFLRAVREMFEVDVRGLRVVVLGAGGAARAVLHALAGAGADALFVWSRSPRPAQELVTEIRGGGFAGQLAVVGDAGSGQVSADLLVNATPASLSGKLPRKDLRTAFSGLSFAMDLVYGSRPTPFVQSLSGVGVRAADGRAMLLHQAALAFTHWFDAPAPLDAMREALARRLESG